MAITFSKYFRILEWIEARQLGKPNPEDVGRILGKRLAAGQAYAGEPYPHNDDPEVHNIHLAAACVGTKPVCMIVPGQLGARNEEDIESILTHEMLAHGYRMRRDFEVRSLADTPGLGSWTLVGGRAAVDELHQLLKFQLEIAVQTSPKLAQMSSEEGAEYVKAIMAGHGTCPHGDWGQASYDCAPLHRRIGELLGYDPEAINTHVQKYAPLPKVPNLPHYTSVPASMQPHMGKSRPLGPIAPEDYPEWYNPMIHMLIYEGFIYVPGISRRP